MVKTQPRQINWQVVISGHTAKTLHNIMWLAKYFNKEKPWWWLGEVVKAISPMAIIIMKFTGPLGCCLFHTTPSRKWDRSKGRKALRVLFTRTYMYVLGYLLEPVQMTFLQLLSNRENSQCSQGGMNDQMKYDKYEKVLCLENQIPADLKIQCCLVLSCKQRQN